jgi:hypothetical protein
MQRRALEGACPDCGRIEVRPGPGAGCGNEFIWLVRCRGCSEWRWFHAREDGDFVRAVLETAMRRGEAGGLSAEGTREAHAAFEAGLPGCSCGGSLRLVSDPRAEPCGGCGSKAPPAVPSERVLTLKPLR